MSIPGSDREITIDPATWVDRHGDTLYRYAMSRLRDRESAEEVVQETFVSALQALNQYSGKGSEGAWLLGILKRKVIDCVRRRNRPDSASGGDITDDPSQTFFDIKGNWRTDPRVVKQCPGACLEREEFWEAFRKCLERLSQRQADVFTLREIEELSGEEICKNLQISTSNLWVLLYRARLQLSGCMKAQLEDRGGH
jgi:RNA polymerase sigma-70 factor (ECF subfamily)